MLDEAAIYDKNYFTSGNYTNYLQRKFESLASDLISELGICPGDPVIDFGCGYGGLLNQLYEKGIQNVTGTDISEWAISYGKSVYPNIAPKLHFYNPNLLADSKRFVFFLDVLEHMPEDEISLVLSLSAANLLGYLVARIPVSARENEPFVFLASRNDSTHISCHSRDWWLDFFRENGYRFVGDIRRSAIYTSDGVLAGKWEFKGC